MSSLMTLREAVEIVANGIPRLLLAEVPIAERIERRYVRARAIVDAAVETWESSCAYSDALDAEPFNGRLCAELCLKWQASEKKLRALERGEGEVQQ